MDESTTPSFQKKGRLRIWCALIPLWAFLAPIAGGQDQEGARLVGPGTISTPEGKEYGMCLTPDGLEAYYTRDNDILFSQLQGRSWTEGEAVSFASDAFDGDPFISADGETLLFMSGRPLVAGEDPLEQENIWQVRRQQDGSWGEAEPLGPRVNSEAVDGFASMTSDGTLYFFSTREGGLGSHDIYRSRKRDGEYQLAENLGSPVNTEHGDGHPFISADERFLIFWSNRPDGYGSCDLYVSYHEDEEWSVPKNLGPDVNTSDCDMTPFVSQDGSRLYFARIHEDGNRDLYSISMDQVGIR